MEPSRTAGILAPIIQRLEGLRLNAYQDVAGVWTIGYGHTGPEVVKGLAWGRQQAEDALLLDIQTAEWAAGRLSPTLVPHIYKLAAITDFVYNLGADKYAHSTLHCRVDTNQWAFVPTELRRWVYAGGIVCTGLKARRETEITLWNRAETNDEAEARPAG